MDKKLMGLLMTAAVGLSACGSGAVRNGMAESVALGEGGSKKTNQTTDTNTNTNTNTTTNNTSSPDSSTGGYQGYMVSLSENGYDVNGGEPSSNYAPPSNDSEINFLKVEGRQIQLLSDDKIGVKDWVTTRRAAYNSDTNYKYPTDTWTLVGNQLKYAKFGELYDQYEKRYRFVQGSLTPNENMPTARGQVKYSGHATYSPYFTHPTDPNNPSAFNLDNPAINKTEPTLGRSEFVVDFGEKAIVGQIQPLEGATTFKPITLQAVIRENKFEGLNTTSNQDSRSAVATGAFYGPNAEEMAGVYYFTTDGTIGSDGSTSIDANKPTGTFGASKQ